MRTILLVLLLTACGDNVAGTMPDAGQSDLRAAETLAATHGCEREARCVDPGYNVEECVFARVNYYCQSHDCAAPYSDWERLNVCVEDYDSFRCDSSTPPLECHP